jgi:sugar O-acyltransferase (sialic acid O-acetyltransferase NeuD family)
MAMPRWKNLTDIIEAMYLFGAGGHARVIIDILESMGTKVDALIDQDESIDSLQGYPVYHEYKDFSPVIISIGNNVTRKKVAERINCEFGKAIHPSAIVSKRAHIDVGTVVMQGAIIQPDAVINKHCIINTGASVDHECVIGDYAHIAPHATLCGNVHVGEGTWIGAGTVIIPGVKIGKWCMIGAGSVVVRDIPDNVVAYGNPCRVARLNK